MSWVAIIFWVITNAPKLVSLIREFISLIKNKPFLEAMTAKQEIISAIKGGDPKDVASVLHKHCNGGPIGCPSDVVQ